MEDQKRKYLPMSKNGLYLMGKRFFDRPVTIHDLLKRSEDLGSWPVEGKTIKIVNRLAELEDILWERRYQPFEYLREFVSEATELSIELTEISGCKCHDFIYGCYEHSADYIVYQKS